MNKTNKLRTELRNRMLRYCSNVYYEEAPTPCKYPYLVYELQELSFANEMTVMQFEVNAIDYGEETEQIEELCDLIQSDFDRLHILTQEFHISVYKDRRQNVQEGDKKIIRRRMLFEIHLHERN